MLWMPYISFDQDAHDPTSATLAGKGSLPIIAQMLLQTNIKSFTHELLFHSMGPTKF
jgi:hypothetical protein